MMAEVVLIGDYNIVGIPDVEVVVVAAVLLV